MIDTRIELLNGKVDFFWDVIFNFAESQTPQILTLACRCIMKVLNSKRITHFSQLVFKNLIKAKLFGGLWIWMLISDHLLSAWDNSVPFYFNIIPYFKITIKANIVIVKEEILRVILFIFFLYTLELRLFSIYQLLFSLLFLLLRHRLLHDQA